MERKRCPMLSPTVSVLIVTHNSSREIGECLDALARGTAVPYEIVVVDNASDDSTAEFVAQVVGVRHVANTRNLGFATAVNQAGQLAGGRYLLLLNPDTVVHVGAVDRLASFLDEHVTAGIAAPRLLNADGRIRHNCFAFETPWSMFWFGIGVGPLRRVRNLMLRHTGWNIEANHPQEVEAVTGAAMLVRRELFEHLGGLDERFFMYCEDGDFCRRAKRVGWRTLLVPEAVVTHIGGASSLPDTVLLNGMIGSHLLDSRYRYTEKYWGRPAVMILRLANAAAGLLFLLASRLFGDGDTRARLVRHGRLLWATSALRKGARP